MCKFAYLIRSFIQHNLSLEVWSIYVARACLCRYNADMPYFCRADKINDNQVVFPLSVYSGTCIKWSPSGQGKVAGIVRWPSYK